MSSECKTVRSRLSAYIDGALREAQHASVNRHLEGCDGCRRQLEQLQGLVKAIGGMPPAGAPAGFAERLNARIAAEPAKRHWLQRLFVPSRHMLPLQFAAAAAMGVLIFFVVFPPAHRQEAMPSVHTIELTLLPYPRSGPTGGFAVRLSDKRQAQEFSRDAGRSKELDRVRAAPQSRPAPAMPAAAPPPAPAGSTRPLEPFASALRRRVAEAGGTLVVEDSDATADRPGSLTIDIAAAGYPRLLESLRTLGRIEPAPPAPPTDARQRVRLRLTVAGLQ